MGNGILQVSFRLPVVTKKKRDCIVSQCPIIDVFSQGKNEDEAIENLIEALQLFFETCYEMGTLEQVLKDCGFASLSPRQETTQTPEIKYVDLPFSLTSSRTNAQAVAG